MRQTVEGFREEFGRRLVVGARVRPDAWGFAAILEPADVQGAEFTMPGYRTGVRNQVEILVTGRTVQRDRGEAAVRVSIVVLGDGEPDQELTGWLYVGLAH